MFSHSKSCLFFSGGTTLLDSYIFKGLLCLERVDASLSEVFHKCVKSNGGELQHPDDGIM